MRRSLIVFGVSAMAAGAMFAQQDVTVTPALPVPPPGAGPFFFAQGAPGGPGNVAFVSREFAFSLKPVKGAPYSADETTQSVQTLADGNHITRTTTAHIDRDSQGRVRREVTLPAPGNDAQPHTLITISDPVAGITYSLDPQTKTALKMTPPPGAAAKFAKFKTTVMEAPAGGHARIEYRDMQRAAPTTHEDLGTQNIAGVNAKGTRQTTTIPANAIGNDMPIVITSERWFSPDLQIEVKSVRNDPRMGETTYSLANVNRTEPDPSLFQVPADYTVKEAKPGLSIMRMRKNYPAAGVHAQPEP